MVLIKKEATCTWLIISLNASNHSKLAEPSWNENLCFWRRYFRGHGRNNKTLIIGQSKHCSVKNRKRHLKVCVLVMKSKQGPLQLAGRWPRGHGGSRQIPRSPLITDSAAQMAELQPCNNSIKLTFPVFSQG